MDELEAGTAKAVTASSLHEMRKARRASMMRNESVQSIVSNDTMNETMTSDSRSLTGSRSNLDDSSPRTPNGEGSNVDDDQSVYGGLDKLPVAPRPAFDRTSSMNTNASRKSTFSAFSNMALTCSTCSVILGIFPLYTYSLNTGGPAVMFWGWVFLSGLSLVNVACFAEMNAAYPTLGGLYQWCYHLGGDEWGGFASYLTGWCNLFGQITGVSASSYSAGVCLANILTLTTGYKCSQGQMFAILACFLVINATINTYVERLLVYLTWVSVSIQVLGVFLIVTVLCAYTGLNKTNGADGAGFASAEFVFLEFNNNSGFQSIPYVACIGTLFVASTYTGYDTASLVVEEAENGAESSPRAMVLSVVNAFVLGTVFILGLNFCIPNNDLAAITDPNNIGKGDAFMTMCLQTLGFSWTVAFQVVILVALFCTSCASMTSASRMVYGFARDDALPCSSFLYHIVESLNAPVRAIWVECLVSFLITLPAFGSQQVLSVLFSFNAVLLYSSYCMPCLLRITTGRHLFKQSPVWNMGRYSYFFSCISVCMCLFMTSGTCTHSLTHTHPTHTHARLLLFSSFSMLTLALFFLFFFFPLLSLFSIDDAHRSWRHQKYARHRQHQLLWLWPRPHDHVRNMRVVLRCIRLVQEERHEQERQVQHFR